MALNPETPAVETVQIVSSADKSITEYHVLAMNVSRTPRAPEATTVFVSWCWGYDESGEFIEAGRDSYMLSGAELLPYMVAAPTGASVEAVTKHALWSAMQGVGKVPDGTVV